MPSGTGTGTETYPIDTDAEWQEGTFSDTTTDGTGSVMLANRTGTLSFDYTIESNSSNTDFDDADVSIIDGDDGTVYEERRVSGQEQETGTITVDISNVGRNLELEATAQNNNDDTAEQFAEISDSFGTTVSVTTPTGTGGEFVSDSQTNNYQYESTGTYTTVVWDFTNTTTASKLTTTTTLPADTSVDATVATADDTSTDTIPLTATASDERVVNVGASDRYDVTLELSVSGVPDATPSVGMIELQTHTPPTNVQITSTDETRNDLSWTGWGSADAYQLYRSESTPVTTSDTLVTTQPGTSYTDSGLENGETYYYNVRAEYTGE